MTTPSSPSRNEIREIAREEALAVYDDAIEDPEGEQWSIAKFMGLGLTRRQAFQAIGLVAVGFGGGGALVKVLTQSVAADATGESGTEANPLEKLWSEEIFNKNWVDEQATSSEGTSYNVNLVAGNYHKVTMTGDVTFDFTNADASKVNSVVLHLVQDGTGSRSPSFTPTVVWDGGSAPSWSTGANEEDLVTFIHDQDGSQWIGLVGGLTLG